MTSVAIVAADTDLLIAYGLGSRADTKSDDALSAVQLARQHGARVVMLPSVAGELQSKLKELDGLFEAIRDALGPNSVDLATQADTTRLEALFSDVRRRVPKFGRLVMAVEAQAVQALRSEPALSWENLLYNVHFTATTIRESVQVRMGSLELDPVSVSGDVAGYEQKIPSQVKGPMDRTHLAEGTALAHQGGIGVVFVVFESPIQANKAVVEAALPGLKVTNPLYLLDYLNVDASTWLG